MHKPAAGLLAVAMLTFAGCAEEKKKDYTSYDKAPESKGHHNHSHSHAGEKGPHGGQIVELASDHSVHGELVHDANAGTAMFYVLGSDMKKPVAADSIEFEVEADGDEKELASTPKPLEGETDSKCSAFEIDLSSLGDMKSIEKLKAHVHVVVDGKEMVGEISHSAHGHDDHAEKGHDHKEGAGHDKDEHGHHDEKDGHGHDKDKDSHGEKDEHKHAEGDKDDHGDKHGHEKGDRDGHEG